MRQIRLTIPQLIYIAATRGILGTGIGMLLAPRVPRRRRRKVGAALVTLGALSTIPVAIAAMRSRRTRRDSSRSSALTLEYAEELGIH